MLANLRKSIDYSIKKQLPIQVPEKFYSKLKINIPLCDEAALNSKMLTCSYFKCFNKRSLGDAVMYSEVIIHGFNSQKNCAISYKDLRYFIPSADLANFVPLFEKSSNLHSDALTAFHANFGKINPVSLVFDIPVQNKICQIKTVYQMVLDKNSAVVSKTPPGKKIEGIVKLTQDNSAQTFYEEDKIFYSPKHRAFNFVPKLLRYELTSGAATFCKGNRTALMIFDFESKGLIRDTSAP